MAPKKRYDTNLRSAPGMTFRVDITDPKERVQAYMDSFCDDRDDASLSNTFLRPCTQALTQADLGRLCLVRSSPHV
jgi:hypothetical protein